MELTFFSSTSDFKFALFITVTWVILLISSPDFFTLSFNVKKNYPFKKEKSDLDVEFDDEADDSEYLKKLENVIPNLIHNLKPDFIFYIQTSL